MVWDWIDPFGTFLYGGELCSSVRDVPSATPTPTPTYTGLWRRYRVVE